MFFANHKFISEKFLKFPEAEAQKCWIVVRQIVWPDEFLLARFFAKKKASGF